MSSLVSKMGARALVISCLLWSCSPSSPPEQAPSQSPEQAPSQSPEQAPSQSPEHVGEVGDVTIDPPELEAYLGVGSERTMDTFDMAARRDAVRSLLIRKALAAEAEREGLHESADAKRAFSQWRMQNYPKHFWNSHMEEIEVSEEELWGHVAPEPMYKVSAIVFSSGEEGREQAEQTHAVLLAGADFGDLAREISQGLLHDKGGDMGWLVFPSLFIDEPSTELLRGMKPGEITDPRDTEIGWVIFLLAGVRSEDEIFAAERERGLADLLAKKRADEKKRLMNKILGKAKIEYPEAEPGAPAVIIDGKPIYRREIDKGTSPRHDFSNMDVTPEKRALLNMVNAYVISREAVIERLDTRPPLSIERSFFRTETLSQAYIRSKAYETIDVSEEEVRAEHQRYYQPRVYSLQVVRVPERSAAEEAFQELEKGADFSAVVEKYSVGRTKKAGGKLATMSLADFSEEVRSAIEGVSDGSYTGVLPNAGAWLIFKRLASREIEIPPLEAVSNDIREKITLKKRSDAVKNFVKKFAEGLDIRIHEEMLREL